MSEGEEQRKIREAQAIKVKQLIGALKDKDRQLAALLEEKMATFCELVRVLPFFLVLSVLLVERWLMMRMWSMRSIVAGGAAGQQRGRPPVVEPARLGQRAAQVRPPARAGLPLAAGQTDPPAGSLLFQHTSRLKPKQRSVSSVSSVYRALPGFT